MKTHMNNFPPRHDLEILEKSTASRPLLFLSCLTLLSFDLIKEIQRFIARPCKLPLTSKILPPWASSLSGGLSGSSSFGPSILN